MNWLMVGILVLLLLMTVVGYKKGFIRKLIGLVAWIVTLVLVSMALPSITEFMRENTNLYSIVQESVTESDLELMQMLRIVGLDEMAGNVVAEKVVAITAFVVTFILVSIVVHGIAKALRLATRLPLLKGTNKLLGAVTGFVEGLFWVWIILLIVSVGSASSWGTEALRMTAEQPILTWLFTNNPILYFLSL